MAMAPLLALPYEILELIIEKYFSSLEISVRYSRGRVTANELQDGASLLLVCTFLYKMAAPLFFESVTFGHHASHLLRSSNDPFSLVLVPANLPMHRFKHICFDFEYATSLFKVAGLWPWVEMKSLVLVDHSLGENKASDASFFARYLFMKDMREVCTLRDVQFSAYIGLGSRQGVRLRLVDGLYAMSDQFPVHREPQAYNETWLRPEIRAFLDDDEVLDFYIVGFVSEKLSKAMKAGFRRALLRA